MRRITFIHKQHFKRLTTSSRPVTSTTFQPTSQSSDSFEYVRTRSLDVCLLGTAHVSRQSASDARWAVHSFNPDSVVLELCNSRVQRLRKDNNQPLEEQLRTLLQLPGDPLAQLLKLGTQSLYRILRLSGMEPGAEFRAAYDAACERNSRVLMGDQSINTTFSRLRQVLPSELPALLSSSLTGQSIFSHMPQEVKDVLSSSDTSFESAVERMKDRRVVRAMSSSLRSSVPQITRVMLDERDDALANSILEQPAGSKVVAIVGMAHLEGVASRLRDNS